MAVDFQCIQPQQSVRLDQIRLRTVAGFLALQVTGEDFRAVDEVVINDQPSPDVVILSKTELLAQLPDSLQQVPDIQDVKVLSNRFVFSARSLVRFRIGKTPGKVRGLHRLVQLFLKTLFTTPGSDIFNPRAGGGALQAVGASIGAGETQNLLTDLVIAVNQTQRQIISQQSRDQRSPRDEKLLSAVLTSASFDKTQGALYVSVELTSQAGRSAVAQLEW
jgi:hypothetical protein